MTGAYRSRSATRPAYGLRCFIPAGSLRADAPTDHDATSISWLTKRTEISDSGLHSAVPSGRLSKLTSATEAVGGIVISGAFGASLGALIGGAVQSWKRKYP